MAQVSFELITPEGLKFQENVYEVMLPTPDGYIGVLPHHIPLITIATPGVISIRRRSDDRDEDVEHMATSGGFVEIDGKRVRLLADSAERAEDIDEFKAQEALKRAKELQTTHADQVSLADAARLIETNLARLKVAELKRRRRK
jgi:F-type H+-transporting ATPase subunit epsilon